jgi:hypothetical protein
MSDTLGVMFDTAKVPFFLGIWYPGLASDPVLHLFESDDTPTASSDPFTFQELNNGSYAPLPVPDGYLQLLGPPPEFHYAVLGAQWDLAPPSPGDDTIFGWWLDAQVPIGSRAMFGGRFSPPVIIPPAGLTLVLDQVNMLLHDCGTPPPPPAGIVLLDWFEGSNGLGLGSHTPLIGGPWDVPIGAWTCSHAQVTTANVARTPAVAVQSLGESDGVLRIDLVVGSDTCGVTVRYQDSGDYWYAAVDGTIKRVMIGQVSGGVETVVASTFWVSLSSSQRLDVVLSADTISAMVEGQASVSFSPATAGQTATQHGLYARSNTHASVRVVTFTAD